MTGRVWPAAGSDVHANTNATSALRIVILRREGNPEVYRPAPRRVGYYENVSTLSLPLDHAAITRILPHRYPFLLVDRIVEFEPDPAHRRHQERHRQRASLLSPPDARGQRMLPPTILTEAVAQVGGILILAKPENSGHLIYFRGIERARFRGAGRPGDGIVIEARVIRLRSRMGLLTRRGPRRRPGAGEGHDDLRARPEGRRSQERRRVARSRDG